MVSLKSLEVNMSTKREIYLFFKCVFVVSGVGLKNTHTFCKCYVTGLYPRLGFFITQAPWVQSSDYYPLSQVQASGITGLWNTLNFVNHFLLERRKLHSSIKDWWGYVIKIHYIYFLNYQIINKNSILKAFPCNSTAFSIFLIVCYFIEIKSIIWVFLRKNIILSVLNYLSLEGDRRT